MGVDTRLYEKVANLVMAGVAEKQIAESCGLDAARISQIKQHEVYQEIISKLTEEEVKAGELFDNGWDQLEQDALAVLVDTMEFNKDPEFALKAATMANKAQRRKGIGRGVIPMNAGAQVVINLTARFVDKLEAGIAPKEIDNSPEKKRNDTLTAKGVQELLSPAEENNTIEGIFDVMELAGVG